MPEPPSAAEVAVGAAVGVAAGLVVADALLAPSHDVAVIDDGYGGTTVVVHEDDGFGGTTTVVVHNDDYY